jgi:class 3 adenylate cyclase/putative methionine-R-sulfoxide reductase with GAF domain
MTKVTRKRATASAAAEGRIAELEAQLRSQADAARTHEALYRIATLASRSESLDEVYPGIHDVLKQLMYAENLYIALYDSDRRQINFAYWVDSVDTDWPDPRLWDPMGEGYAKGLTGYVLKTGRMLHANVEGQQRLIDEKQLEFIGAMANDYLAIPLETEGRTIGVLALQSYRPDVAYTRDDEELLSFVGQHIAAALARAQATAELRQRNAELAIINQVGRALVTQRETQAVMEAVGVGAAEALGTSGLSICLVDPLTDALVFGYWVDEGGRNRAREGVALGDPISAEIVRSDRPMRIASADEAAARGFPFAVGGTESYLGVPIHSGDRAIGVFAVGTHEHNAYGDADERLLSTLAASMGVALDNARLHDLEVESAARQAELLRTIERQTQELSRFLSPQVAALISSPDGEQLLAGHRRIATSVFCDLRGFTSFSEAAEPEEVLGVLRDYHAALGALIVEHGGTLEHFAGDGLMVFFNDPVPQEDHVERAVLMAVEMRRRFDQLAAQWSKLGHDLGLGIGIATGYATLGRIGFEGRYDYGMIGTAVITASRLSSAAAAGQILLAPRSFAAVEDLVDAEPVGELELKGFSRPISPMSVIGLRDGAVADASARRSTTASR